MGRSLTELQKVLHAFSTEPVCRFPSLDLGHNEWVFKIDSAGCIKFVRLIDIVIDANITCSHPCNVNVC